MGIFIIRKVAFLVIGGKIPMRGIGTTGYLIWEIKDGALPQSVLINKF